MEAHRKICNDCSQRGVDVPPCPHFRAAEAAREIRLARAARQQEMLRWEAEERQRIEQRDEEERRRRELEEPMRRQEARRRREEERQRRREMQEERERRSREAERARREEEERIIMLDLGPSPLDNFQYPRATYNEDFTGGNSFINPIFPSNPPPRDPFAYPSGYNFYPHFPPPRRYSWNNF
ncbi:hypothetical protein BT69DRAFT_1320810 [Atractiella rhizophila]|nr:hypothetical protein BT69DRAFT_1320810 [Atractiella rhizophila]